MRKLAKEALAIALIWPAAVSVAAAQTSTSAQVSNTMPTADFGFNLPTSLGTLSYSLTASEFVRTGYESRGVYASTSGGGNLAYLSKSERSPFSLVYSGGFIHSDIPGQGENETYQDLSFSQVMRTKAWVYVVSDAFSYLPESPTTGLSGIAGVGDVGIPPVQTGIGPDQDILSDYGRRISNGLNGSATWQVGSSTELEGSARWGIFRFPGAANSGLDTNQYAATFGPTYRINALNSIGADAYYSRENYPGYAGTVIESDGVTVTYNRNWSRLISTSVGLGPERTHGEGFGTFPSRLNLSANASATYAGRQFGASLTYSRGTNGGGGVLAGAFSDRVTLGATRPLGRDWSVGVDGSYSRSVALFTVADLQTRAQSIYGGVQMSRRLTETLSCYLSDTVIDQSLYAPLGAINAFSGVSNTVGFGITFSPRPLHRAR